MPKLRTDIDKIFFSIGEVAKKYNVNVSLIRFWEKEFDILKLKKTKKAIECSQKKTYIQSRYNISFSKRKRIYFGRSKRN